MAISKAEIDRLGNLVRQEGDNLTEKTLDLLQEYRISHKDVLSKTFKMLCVNSRKTHPSTIVTYRIKRFQSIIGKLGRYPEMRFSRMWDIGGCRCILRNNKDVYKLKELISKEEDFEIVKEKDYIKEPQEDGYRSLHLFLKYKYSDKIIEIQLRNQVDHNWATLVEITDVIFDSKLKELSENPELLRFHLLLSRISKLDIKDKKEIAEILKKYNYFEQLSTVFSRNHIKVRLQWYEIENKSNHKYFLIESNKDQIPRIMSFKSPIEAEEVYYNIYKSRTNANIVLTHLQTPNYNQISIAYSNYILTFHTFLNECFEIIESIMVESLEHGHYYEYLKTYNLYNNLVFNHIRNLVKEIQEIQTYNKENINNRNRNRKKEKEWANDIQKQINQSIARGKKLSQKFKHSMPKNYTGKTLVRLITFLIRKKYQRKIKRLPELNKS